MLQPIDVNERFEYVSKEDTGEVKTIFVFKPISTKEMFSFAGSSENGQLKLNGDNIFKFLEISIAEIKNYKEGSVKDLLDTFSASVIAELVQEAGRLNKMTGQDQKN